MLHSKLLDKIDNYNEDVSYNGVYLIYHTSKPEMVYIGSTKRKYNNKKCKNGCYGRWVEHYNRLSKNIHKSHYLQSVINKYGLNGIRFKVLERTDINVRVREKFYIDKYDSYHNGYNLSNETEYISMTEEYKLKASIRMRNNNPMKKKDVVKKRLKTKQELSPPLRVLQYTTKGEFVKEWESINAVSEELEVDFSNINRNINGETKTSIGYLWFYKLNFSNEILKEKLEKYNTKYVMSEETKNKMSEVNGFNVYQYDLDMNLINEFNSFKKAGDFLGVAASGISRCVNGEYKQYKGFIWRTSKICGSSKCG